MATAGLALAVLLSCSNLGGMAPRDTVDDRAPPSAPAPSAPAPSTPTVEPASAWPDHPENTWVKRSPRDDTPAPGFGWEGAGAFDPFLRKWIHEGGHDGVPQGFAMFVWDLPTARWEQRFPPTSPPGVCVIDGAGAYDLANRRLARFPGASLGHGYQFSRGVYLKQSNAWLYDPVTNAWTNMRPPPYAGVTLGSLNPAVTYDARHEVLLDMGGQTAKGDINSLFAYDAYANQLEQLQAQNPPAPRDGHGIAYDARNDALVVFGSQYASDEKTWIYRYKTNRWEGYALDPHPPGTKGSTYSTIPKMACDSINGVCLLLTWEESTGAHQTWILDVAQMKWTRMNPAVEPEPSGSRTRNLGYSPEHNAFLLETWTRPNTVRIWSYRYKKAAPDARPAPPSGLEALSSAGKATLSWQPSATAAVTGYRVYRARADRAWQTDYARVADVATARYEDGGLEAGAIYFYTVKAVGSGGVESDASVSARTQPRVLVKPVVSVLARDRIEVTWNAHPAPDVVGYNVYRGVAAVRTVTQGVQKPWSDNDPLYREPQVVGVRDITNIVKLNPAPLAATALTDTGVDLTQKGPEAGGYKFAVHAYIVRAVNRLGTESGPSPYALTIPSEPVNVLLKENGGTAEIRWDASPEKGIAGYRIYKLGSSVWEILGVTSDPIKATTFTHAPGSASTRYWVTAVDALGQEGQPSSEVWYGHSYKGFFTGEWHQ
jgi:fibronectin type 3 domain-containing protein